MSPMQKITLRELMVQRVLTCTRDTSVLSAAHIMGAHNVSCLLVVEDNYPIGIITERDVLQKVFIRYRDANATRVDDVMSYPVEVIDVAKSLRETVQLMHDRKI